MAVNKVEYFGKVLLDLTEDTITEDTLHEGVTAHDKSGAKVTGKFTLENEMTTQDGLISAIKTALQGKAAGGTPTPTQEKTVEITENGTVEVLPDDGYALSKVTANVNVPIPEGYIKPSGNLDITENGTHDVTEYASVNVNVPTSGGGGGEIPSGYTKVDFIEFNGKQLVDTGIIGNQDTQITASFTWGNATQNHLYGCASSDNTASITSYMNGSWRFGSKSATKTISKNNTLLPYSSRVNKTMIGVTNSNTSISDVNDFETVATLLLGGARNATGGLPSSGIVGRVLYFNIWDGETQIMKLIPVTDGTAYRFYDLITKTFFDSITDTPLGGGNL